MKKGRMLTGIFSLAFERMGLYEYSFVRKAYWNLRARDIFAQWGRHRDDYDLLRDIMASIPSLDRILDVGCGSGRLFPLYESLGIGEVVAQDISEKALALARRQYECQNVNIRLVNLPIEALNFPSCYFDLVISSRVLQHITPNAIEPIISSMCRFGRSVFVNELSATDGVSENPCLFMHEYTKLFRKCGHTVKNRGLLGNQAWLLFAKHVANS